MNINTNILNIRKSYPYKLYRYTHSHTYTFTYIYISSSNNFLPFQSILSLPLTVTKIKIVETLRHSVISCVSVNIWQMGSKRGVQAKK